MDFARFEKYQEELMRISPRPEFIFSSNAPIEVAWSDADGNSIDLDMIIDFLEQTDAPITLTEALKFVDNYRSDYNLSFWLIRQFRSNDSFAFCSAIILRRIGNVTLNFDGDEPEFTLLRFEESNRYITIKKIVPLTLALEILEEQNLTALGLYELLGLYSESSGFDQLILNDPGVNLLFTIFRDVLEIREDRPRLSPLGYGSLQRGGMARTLTLSQQQPPPTINEISYSSGVAKPPGKVVNFSISEDPTQVKASGGMKRVFGRRPVIKKGAI